MNAALVQHKIPHSLTQPIATHLVHQLEHEFSCQMLLLTLNY